jgi:hypothetical protein
MIPIFLVLWNCMAASPGVTPPPPVARKVTTAHDARSYISYDAKKLTAELADFPEVPKADFYYLRIGALTAAHGVATLSTGESVEWFHYECGGLYLRFQDRTERYFLHPATVAEMKAEKVREVIFPREDRR